MSIYVSATTPGFFTDANIPADAKTITIEQWNSLLADNAAGKNIDFSVYPPVAIDPPPVTYTTEQLISLATEKRSALRSDADSQIAWLQDAVDLNTATDDEIARLTEWKLYRIAISRIDLSQPENITWPTVPTGGA
ncbi:tail fiber assembly protein [Raoultella sp. HC6]|uniref:tail fiber assembly protein n=1 Tax=Raoultella sp. HC6 TaxID=2923366 RepID=UPI001F50DF3E|nr:tail fiber assembly protein [Raoultella sp. HC6]